MSTHTKPESSSAIGRRTFMKAGSVGAAAAIAGVAVATSSPVAAAGGKSVDLWVDADLGTFLQVPAPSIAGTGPFYVGGAIYARSAPGGPVIGHFECWGFIYPDPADPTNPDVTRAVVTQEFDLDGRGKIIIAGVEGTDPRSVTGGSGDFANARGVGIPSGGPGSAGGSSFTIDFNLTGASGPPIT